MGYTISATDARRLMRGDGINLWKEKKGLATPADLSGVLRVQIGLVTEAFNLSWWQRNHDNEKFSVSANVAFDAMPAFTPNADRRLKAGGIGGVCEYVNTDRVWQTCTPDGVVWNKEADHLPLGLIDAKHTREIGDGNEPYSVIQANYWQFVHQMMVTGFKQTFVSVLYGNDEWRPFVVQRSEDDIATLLGAELMFLRELESDTPPGLVVEAPVDRPIPGVPTRKLTTSDVESANWASDFIAAAGEFVTNYDSDKRLDAAKKALRGFLPEDAVKIEAFGVRVNRTQRGIVISQLKEKAA